MQASKSNQTDRDHLQLALASGKVGIWELDAQSGGAWRNPRHDEIFGYAELLPEWNYALFLSHVLPEDRAAVDQCYGQAITQGREWSFECRIRRVDGEERWISAYGRPLRSHGGPVSKFIGHVIDITESKRNEEHLRLVTSELNHRVRNMLAMIKALVQVSARGTDDIDEFAAAIESRVAALARTHDLLAVGQGGTITLSDVMHTELAAFMEVNQRVELQFDTGIALHGRTAERLVLAIHELMTNAIKYGALSNDSGRVILSSERLGPDRVRLYWRETGGPPVMHTGRTGFGSTLLSQALGEQGHIDLDFRPEGLLCSIEMLTAHAVPPTESVAQPPAPADASIGSLAGKRVMVVEDQPLIAISYRSQLERMGARVIGPLVSCAEALAALAGPDGRVDAAILDVDLGDETSDAVADELLATGVPFIFTTGYGDEIGLARRYPDAIVLLKPAGREEIEAGLKQVIAKAACPDAGVA